VLALLEPLPYTTYAPGPTINVLGTSDGKEIIQAPDGHKTYRDDGQLRMTTVSVTQRDARLDLLTLMWTWVVNRNSDALYPYAIQYGDGGSQQQDTQEGQVEMIRSQDSAIASALRELGYKVHPVLEILAVTPDMPAVGKLKPRDVVRSFDGKPVTAATQLAKLIAAVPAGDSAPITVERKGRTITRSVTPVDKDGTKLIGVTLGLGYTFPFKVSVNISDAIGGPSAGLMFALSIYDTLTPGSLTDGGSVAGTGTITGNGRVGEIGGIQQKIVGARQDGAQLFLVPPANCPDAMTSHHGSMRLAKATSLHSAIDIVRTWAKDHDAQLPQCTAADGNHS